MKNLLYLRKNASLTQLQLSKNLNLAKATYARYEVGESEPTIETIIKIADYFNCSIDYLLGHETPGILHLDSFTPAQQKLIELIKQLNPDQTLQTVGYCSALLKTSTELPRPW